MYEIDDSASDTHWLTILWVSAFLPAVVLALFILYQTNMIWEPLHKTMMIFNCACLFEASPTRDLYSKQNLNKAETSYNMRQQLEDTKAMYSKRSEIGSRTPITTLKF